MTQTAADISPFANPIYFDKVAADLNTKLDVLGYINDLYGVCTMGFDDEDSYPLIYVNDGTKINLRVLPDSVRSLSFFIVTGDMTEIDEEAFQIPMAYILWGNLQEIDNSKAYDFSPEILRDVYNVLAKYGCADISVNVTDPLSDFSELDKALTSNTMRPYFAQRYDFVKNVQSCSWT